MSFKYVHMQLYYTQTYMHTILTGISKVISGGGGDVLVASDDENDRRLIVIAEGQDV